MSEISDKENLTPKTSPTSETFKHLRHQIQERMPEAKARIFDKSGTTPTNRELINAAGEQLRQEIESDYDVLTGIFNKNGYEKQVKKIIRKLIDDGQQAAVAVIDLDDLKKINDSKGHIEGDLYLEITAKALKEASRDTDIVARIGGDEFRAFLVNTTPELAAAWKERVLKIFEIKNVKASIGLSPVDLENMQESVDLADKQMYVEKRRKKNRNVNPITKIINFVKQAGKKAA